MSLINKNQPISHLIIIKQPECFPKSDSHLKSMNKLNLNKPAIILIEDLLLNTTNNIV